MNHDNWHSKTTSAVLEELSSTTQGLISSEAIQKINIYGKNEIEVRKRFSILMKFLRQFHNTLIYVLLLSAIVTLCYGHIVDSSIIFSVIIANAILGIIQEGKAENALEELNNMLAPTAIVIRDNIHKKIPANLLVLGDIVPIKAGDKIPADLRVIESKNLQIQESILTGESNPVDKDSNAVTENASLGERHSMAYSGTIAIYGKGIGIVVETGKNTEIGKISKLLAEVKSVTTPLLRSMDKFGRWLTFFIVLVSVFTYLIGVFIWNQSLEVMFMAAVALAVAAIPEGLPPVLTIILAIGVTRMAKRNAIVRHLPSVETMGAVTVICTDKTGTLTINDQTVQSIITIKEHYQITETGNIINLPKCSDLMTAINAAILCNDIEYNQAENGQLNFQGNPMDKALLMLGIKAQIDPDLLRKKYPQIDLIPYESKNKYMATLHHEHINKGFIYLKGAPEKILEMCSLQQNNLCIEPLDYSYWDKQTNYFAQKGYRILAIAYKEISFAKKSLDVNDINHEMTLIALFGFIDPPRTEATAAIQKCFQSGINIKMITGDHALTATTIGSQVGINIDGGVLLGNDIESMSSESLAQHVNNINIYARTSPAHKIKLVQALQTKGDIVAMTGDGVNDSPALRQADIGIAMGEKGAAIAKEAATIILADDNFATIVDAIEEGRIIFDNIRKVILFTLPTNIAMAMIIIIAVISGLVLPITPLQILWVNTVSAITLSIALGFEPAETDVMHRPPRDIKASILPPIFIWRIFFITILLVGVVFFLFTYQHFKGLDLNVNRTMAVNMLVLGEIVCLIHCRKFYASAISYKSLWENKSVLGSIIAVFIFQLLFTYLPFIQRLLATSYLTLNHWICLLFTSLIIFLIMELEKLFVRNSKLILCFK